MTTHDEGTVPRRPANLVVAVLLMVFLFPVIAGVTIQPFRLLAAFLPVQSIPHAVALALWGFAVLASLASALWCCRASWRRLPR